MNPVHILTWYTVMSILIKIHFPEYISWKLISVSLECEMYHTILNCLYSFYKVLSAQWTGISQSVKKTGIHWMTKVQFLAESGIICATIGQFWDFAQPHIQCILGALSWALKFPGHGADHSSLFDAEVKDVFSYTSSFSYTSYNWACTVAASAKSYLQYIMYDKNQGGLQ